MAICSLTLAGSFLVLPTEAEAKRARPFSAEFSLRASNGYLVSVVGGRHEVAISVFKRRLRSSGFVETVYTAPGVVSKNEIEANLGSLGEISLRFIPSGKVITKRLPKPPEECKVPRDVVRRQGTFFGIVRFEGEAGYSAVDVTEVSGSIGTPEGMVCGSFTKGSGGEARHHNTFAPPLPYLGVSTAHKALSFAAMIVGHLRQHSSFVASSLEKNGAISIFRWASVAASRSAFKFDRRLTTASVTPPPPFSGAAIFRRGRETSSPSWTGSLTVSFAGATGVRLTGSNFRASISDKPLKAE